MMVSFFPTITATTGGQDYDLAQILTWIQQGKWADLVQLVRSSDSKTERRLLKNKLPYFTVSGTFATRNDAGLLQHSGAVALDIDADQNPGVDLAEARARIEQDGYTMACFTSAGGEGYCVIVRIPSNEHAGSFRSLQAYYLEAYGLTVDSLPDVSRPRFVSFDPGLHYNPQADRWEDVAEAPQAKPRPAPQPASSFRAPTGEGYGAGALRIACEKVLSAPDGQKHVTLNKMAFLCGGYIGAGFLSEFEARDALRSAISSRQVDDTKGAFKTIEDGLLAGQKKPILPDALQYQARQKLRSGDLSYTVANELAAAQHMPFENVKAAVEAIVEEQKAGEQTIRTFWHVDDPGNDKPLKLSLVVTDFHKWLSAAGFRKHLGSGGKYQLVHIEGHVVREVVRGEIKDFVRTYLESLPFEFDGIYRSQLEEAVVRQSRLLFEDGTTEFLDNLGGEFLRDSKTAARFYFRNGWAEVTRLGYQLRPYEDLPGLVWHQQLRDRHFTPLGENEACTADFFTFLWNIAGQKDERLAALMSLIGYYLHGYKDPSNPRVGILVDEALGANGEANGGTGKSLVFKALHQLIPVTVIDGRAYDPKDKHAMQEVSEATRLILFDDWDGRRLSFDRLFNMATGTLVVTRLFLGQKSYEYAVSPKLAITTNDMVTGEGGSHARRRFELEIAPYYGAGKQPKDEFGQAFFDDWDADEWIRFDNLLLLCCQRFLAAGLVSAASVNLERRKLLQATSPAFADFMGMQERGVRLYRSELLAEFREQEGYDEKTLTPERFGKWLNAYKQYGDDFEVGQDWTDENGKRGQRWIEIPYKKVGGLRI